MTAVLLEISVVKHGRVFCDTRGIVAIDELVQSGSFLVIAQIQDHIVSGHFKTQHGDYRYVG